LQRRRLGHGGFNGGVHWGLAATHDLVIVPISDSPSNENSDKTILRPGISALRLSDGEILWQHRFRHRQCDAHDYRCYPSLSAAPTIAGDLVFAGGLDGILRAFDLSTGEQLWCFDTVRSYRSVDGTHGFGGSIDSGGPVLDGEQLFITSGYDKFGEIPGNVVLSFRLRTAETTRPSGAQSP
jgi:polyvinyl alcohol dehydrogenase (cytochrome)